MPIVVLMNATTQLEVRTAYYKVWIFLACERRRPVNATLIYHSEDFLPSQEMAGEIERLLFVLQNMADYTGLPIAVTTKRTTINLIEGWDE